MDIKAAIKRADALANTIACPVWVVARKVTIPEDSITVVDSRHLHLFEENEWMKGNAVFVHSRDEAINRLMAAVPITSSRHYRPKEM